MRELTAVKLKSWLSQNKYSLLKGLFVITVFLYILTYVLNKLNELRGADISFNLYYLGSSFFLTVFYVFNYSLIWQYITIKNGCSIELGQSDHHQGILGVR